MKKDKREGKPQAIYGLVRGHVATPFLRIARVIP
jgi:hypothetical protein